MQITWRCQICDREKTTSMSRVGKFCSLECTGIFNSNRLDTNTTNICEICNKEYKTKPSHKTRRTCSKYCSGLLRVREGKDCGSWNSNNSYDKSHNWTGGRRIKKNGYVEIFLPDGTHAEHRYVVEQHLGRKLTSLEHIHHIDEDKTNNDISNLQIVSKSEHSSYHAKKRMQDGTHHFLK